MKYKKKHKKKEPREIEPEDFEEEEEEPIVKIKKSPENQVAIGDLIITTNGSLLKCKKMAMALLSEKKITKYLGFYKQKKFLSEVPLGVG